ncbi:hypothetical protein IFM89_014722 [Coptis chinensis]|uniref:Uncharacterized protein n=1 Tax=Coptis chinensis TaxID=261450 RepID=A0A835LIN2_9MAGN|nr:hypothetical protein IFM89_014722 [Coptis chinensis]
MLRLLIVFLPNLKLALTVTLLILLRRPFRKAPHPSLASIFVDAGKDEVLANGALKHEEKDINEPEEENALEGEFIKVEKEALDVKDSPHTDEATRDLEIKPSVV